MSLTVTCPDCDKSLKVKDEFAGKKIRCPGCSGVVAIPRPSNSDDDDFLSDLEESTSPKRRRRAVDLNENDDDDEPVSRPRPRKSARKQAGRSKSGGPNWLLIGGIVGGGVALLFVAVFVFAVIIQVQKGLSGRSAMAANWTTFKHPLGFAQVDMPGIPTFNAMQSKNGVQTYSLAQRNYQMSLTAIQLDPNAQRAIESVPGTIDLMFGEMQRQTPTQMPGSTLISSRQLTAGSMRGLEMKIGLKGTVNMMRFYVTPTALIGAEFVTRNESTYAADRERFFNSFRGPDGNVIDGPAQPPGQAPSGAHAATAGHTGPVPPTPAALPPGVKPAAPLQLTPPQDAQRVLAGVDLSKEDPRLLGALAQQAATEDNDFAKAAQLQFWSVKGTGEGQYNLACYLSRSGQSDAAFHWLQVAALEEGVDSEWATQDADMRPLWRDPRWNQVLPFLKQCNVYWSTSQQTDTQLVMPAGVSPTEPIPVMIGLHGMGSSAKGFVDAESFQEIANQKRIAFLGVSGTIPRGPKSFVWSEDPVKDAARVDAALNEVKDRLTPKAGQLVLFGFSQGGMMSAEIAVRAPDRYSGALVMSPGGGAEPQSAGFRRPANGRTLNAVCICGAGEHPGNVRLTQTYANLFRQAGARVIHKPYPNMDTHSFPPDFETQLPRWIDFLLGISPSA